MKNIISKEIKIPPFGVFVRLLVGDSIEECLKYWDENLTPSLSLENEDHRSMNGLFIFKKEIDGLFYYGLILRGDIPLHTIAHEVFHVVMKIASDKGCTWDESSDEWYAYCIGEVFENVYKSIIEYNDRLKA